MSSYSHFKCYPHNGRRVWVGWEWNFNPKHFATLDSIEKLSSRIGLAKESLGNDLQDLFYPKIESQSVNIAEDLLFRLISS